MKLHFETWLDTQRISEEAQASFNESFICFKVGAYRAALLSAYVGFMNVIADRILNAECPSPFPSDWGKLQDSVNATKSPDVWEKNTFYVANRPRVVNVSGVANAKEDNPKRVFVLSDDFRKQVEYWRSRRNDCAHSKPNKIIAAHVEAFYAFLESNLGKFAVSGSKLQMQEKIRDCFDSNRTDSDKLDDELQNIIADELPNSLENSEYPDFVEEVISELRKKNNSDSGSQVNKFLKLCLEGRTQTLEDACTQFLNNSSTEDLANFLREYPDKCTVIKGEDKKMRFLWKTELFKKGSPFEKDVCLLASLLNNRVIPENENEDKNERKEAIRGFIESCRDIPLSFLNNESGRIAWNTLKENGILDILREKITDNRFDNSDGWKIEWASANRYFIVKYLEDREISKDIVKIICVTFSDTHNPLPYWLKDSAKQLEEVLNDFFSKHEEKKKEFLRLAKEHEIAVPTKHLPALKKV